jgi:hypothetical protein
MPGLRSFSTEDFSLEVLRAREPPYVSLRSA